MATHSSTVAWKIPWTEETGRPQSIGRYESDTTERLHFHFSLSCFGGGNGNPLQYPCLGNPMDIGAGWATVHVVWKSQTQLSSHTDTLDRIWESNIFSHCTMQLRYIKLLHIVVDPKGHGLGEEKDGQGHLKRGSESRTSWVPKYTALWVRWQQRWRPR